MSKSPYELWKEDKARREKGQYSSFREASKASRIQYNLPQYSSRSEKQDNNLKWEKDLLSGVKGKSNNDKFKKVTQSLGMSDGEAQDFRRFLDFQEDSKQEYTKNKDGSMRKGQQKHLGQGTKLQSDVTTSILKQSDKRANDQIKQREQAKKLKEKKTTERDGLLGFLDRTAGRASRAAQETIFGEDFVKNQDENYRRIADKYDKASSSQMLNTTSREANGALEKGADIVGGILGEIAPYTVGYGVADKALKATKLASELKNPLLTDLVRGGVAGTLVGTGKAVARDMSSEDYGAKDYAKDIGLEALLAGGGDAAFGAIARNLNLKGQLDELLKGSSKYDEETFKKAINEAFGQKGNPTNVLAPKPKADPQDIISQLQKDFNLQTPKEKPKFSQDELDFQQELFSRRQADEDTFIKERMKPFDEMLNRSGQAELEWNTSVKQAKEMTKRIKDGYGPIIVPEGNWSDWGHELPNQFKAKRGETKGVDLYTFADQEGFSSVDEAVQFLKELAATSSTKLKDLKPVDDMKVTSDQYDQLVEAARKEFSSSDIGKQYDTLIESILGKPKATSGKPLDVPVPKTQTRSDIDSILRKPDVAMEQSRKLMGDGFDENVAARQLDVWKGNQAENPNLLRSNLQAFNPAETNPMVNTSVTPTSETVLDSIKNPVSRAINKFYESYVNRLHSTKVLDKQHGTEIEKALQNEAVSGNMAKDFLDKHFSSLMSTVKGDDKELANALEYQMAKNLLFNKSKNPDYKLPKGWDWERLAEVEAAGKGKYKNFTQAFRDLTQEWRDTMLEYGLITKDEHAALGQNEFYIPMYRDRSFKNDNIDAGHKGGKREGKRGADPLILHDWEGGDLDTFYKNPIETVITNSFRLFDNALKNDTGLQFKKLAEIEPDNGFVKAITAQDYQKSGGIEVFDNGQKSYLRVQKDLSDLLDELDETTKSDVIQWATSIFARLKTSSLEYQASAVARDLGQSFVTSQAGPFMWLKHAFDIVKEGKNGTSKAKELGTTFEKAYTDHLGGMDPEKLRQEYAKQHQNITNVNLKDKNSLKGLGQVLLKIAKLPLKPAQMVGQYTDNLPREIEIRETQRLFNQKYGPELESLQQEITRLDQAIEKGQNAPDFSSDAHGIDQMRFDRDKAEARLRELSRDLKREQIYRARDVMNYSRMGRGGVAKFIKKYVIFANTTTQSKDKLIRSFAEKPLQTTLKAGIAVAPFVAAQKIMMDSMSEDDRQLYADTPDYIKQYNYVFVNDGKVFTVPKIHELALLTNPMEQVMADESLDSSISNAVKEAVPYQLGGPLSGLVPKDGKIDLTENGQLPTFLGTPILDAWTNQKTAFNQKPISYPDLARDKEGLKANDWTTEFMKGLVGDTPKADYLEYLTRQYGGDAGKYGLATAESIKKKKLDELLKGLNPLQDRYYQEDSSFFKSPIRK